MNIKFISLYKKTAFTLAEVLITLGVIGVVAAITMPTLIKNYQKHVAVNQLKKAYSELSQAIALSESENESFSNWDLSYGHSKEFFDTYLRPYFKKSLKEYNYDASGSAHSVYLNNGVYLQISVKNTSVDFIIKINRKSDSTRNLFRFIMIPKNSNSNYSCGIKGKLTPLCEGTLANGKDRTYLLNKCKSDYKYCSAVIMFDGWEISNDYPW